MSEAIRSFLDDEHWLYVDQKLDRYGGIICLLYGHEGEHRFDDDRCPCGVLDLGIVT